MTAGYKTRRGYPLLVLGLLLAGWAGMRALTWQSPLGVDPAPGSFAADALLESVQRMDAASIGAGDAPTRFAADEAPNSDLPNCAPGDCPSAPWARLDQPLANLLADPLLAPAMGPIQRDALGPSLGDDADAPPLDGRAHIGQAPGLALAQAPGTPAAARQTEAPLAEQAAERRPRRWTGDAWLLLREDSAAPLLASQPSYGRSQAGAVLRYLLAPSSGHRPQAYVRASGALEAPRDVELAGGLSARPVAQLPVRVAAELRVADTQGGTDLRPAAYVVTELPPQDLPLGMRGELYAQAGYVGGDFATAFIDGQARVLRDLTQVGGATVSAAAAAWGGAQKGASRLDIGPSAIVSFQLGEVNARVALDYRLRVAGSAKPRSGPALTLAAGF